MRIKLVTEPTKNRYPAKVTAVMEGSNMYGKYLHLKFTITEGDLFSWTFSGFVKPVPINGSKFYSWMVNILGEVSEADFFTEDLIGKECIIELDKHKKIYVVKDVFPKTRDKIML